MKEPQKENTRTGPLSISSKGIGYFRLDPEDRNSETWEIQTESLKHALPGDVVEVKKIAKVLYNKQQAEVVKIVERTKTDYVGTIDKDPSGKNPAVFIIPDDRRLYRDIEIDTEHSKVKTDNLTPGTKVLASITDWPEKAEYPSGIILEVIGKAGVNDTEMRAIALERGFRDTFPTAVEAEAHAIKISEADSSRIAEEITKRRDMRTTTTFTIDPADAKDFDDALSIKKLDNGNFEIGVHIADVSHFVTPGTALDTEARKRALSVYLVDRTIPMLPEILSNDLCSLNPNEDKYTFSAVFEITPDAEIKSRWFGKTVIHSDKRFTYEDAQAILDAGAGLYIDELTALRAIGKILETEKFQNGAINFEADEVKFVLDENGKPLSVYRKERKDTHKLIEEFMLLANREVAEFIFTKQNDGVGIDSPRAQSVYRIHDAPDKERIEELATFLKAIGYHLKHKEGEVTARDISALLHEADGKPEEELIKTATLRSMSKAIYSTKNIGHFGLGFDYYTHFTSPIRRYPDLMVHRLLERELTAGKVGQDEFAVFEKICHECSEREKQAADAERGSIKYKQVEYMQGHVGETFEGIISGITDWGVYIEEKETKCEGMVKIRDLGSTFDDFFSFNEKTYSMSGEKTGRTFTLGDTVRFKVMNADLEKKMLDYAIVK